MSLATTLIEPLVSDAEELAAIGFATPEDIDTAMQLGAGHPHGPLGTTPRDGDVEALVAVPGSAAIIGTGTMATGIAEVFAKAGAKTTVIGRTVDRAASVLERIDRRLERSVQLGKLEPAARSRVVADITVAASADSAAGVDLVVEAVAEDLEVKQTVFAELERATSEIPLATNTSSFRVAEISAGLHSTQSASSRSTSSTRRPLCGSSKWQPESRPGLRSSHAVLNGREELARCLSVPATTRASSSIGC